MATRKSQKASEARKEEENVCPVCHDRMDIFAVGRCDHTVCYRCATRMRVLCNQMYCAICRADLQKVLFLHRYQKFDSIVATSFCLNREFMIFFEDSGIKEKFQRLLENRCRLCPPSADLFPDFSSLKKHMQNEHSLFYCDLCIKNLKLFSSERKTYNRQLLATHRRQGDEDDKSYKGHPLCKFCDERYFDNDELLLHLRKQHFFCHICEADGVTNEYFPDYELLREHFKHDHFLCEEGSCKNAQLVNAFRSETCIEYRAHWKQHHSCGADRGQMRQMCTLDIDVNFMPREGAASSGDGRRGGRTRGGSRLAENRGDGRSKGDYADRGGGGGRSDVRDRREAERKRREEIDHAHALSATLASVQRQGHISIIDPILAQNSAIAAATPAAATSSVGSSSRSANFQRRSDDFPTLGSAHVENQRAKPDNSGNEDQVDEQGTTQPNDMSLTLAKKVALSNRFSVGNGQLTNSEFPSLPASTNNVRAPHSRSALTEADFPTLSSNSSRSAAVSQVWSTNGNTNAKGASAKARGHSAKAKESKIVEEDFPSLSVPAADSKVTSTAAGSLSSLADISRNFSSNSLSAMGSDTTNWGPGLTQNSVTEKNVSKPTDNLLHLEAKRKGRNKSSKVAWSDSSAVPDGFVSTTFGVEESGKSANAQKLKGNQRDKKEAESKPVATSQQSSKGQKQSDNLEKKKVANVTSKGGSKEVGLGNDVKAEKSEGDKTAGTKQQKSSNKSPGSDATNEKQPQEVEGKSKKQKQKGKDSEKKSQDQKKENEVKMADRQKESAVKNEKPEPLKADKKSPVVSKKNSKATEVVDCSDRVSSIDEKLSKSDVGVDCQNLGQGIGGVGLSVQLTADASPVFTADDFPDLASKHLRIGGIECILTERNMLASNTGVSLDPPNIPACTGNLSVQPTADASPAFTAGDFPDLASKHLRPHFSAPPGFSGVSAIVTKPPPGFNTVQAPVRPPPGLSVPVVSTGTCEAEIRLVNVPHTAANFVPPKNSKERNSILLQEITDAVKDEASFRQLSTNYRLGQVSAFEFHEQCLSLMDPTLFRKIFPELIALLPDIPKQQDLLKAHRAFLSVGSSQKTHSWSVSAGDDLTSCVICGQVLRTHDHREHEVSHNFDADYPSLSHTLCSVR